MNKLECTCSAVDMPFGKFCQIHDEENEVFEHIGWWYQNRLACMGFSTHYPFPIGHPVPEGYTYGKIYRQKLVK